MSDFRLIYANKSVGARPASYVVAVEPCPIGALTWTDNAKVMGHECATLEDWDEMIDRLVKSLEKVRCEGHAKLAAD